MQLPDKYPEVLVEMISLMTPVLHANGVGDETADAISFSIAEQFRAHFGGQMIYICKGQESELSERDRKLWAEYNGRNKMELIHKYDITEVWFYKIIKRAKALELKKRQDDLFGDTE